MLTHLLAIGLFAAPDSGGASEIGEVIATKERTAVLTVVQTTASRGAALPLGAALWPQQYDPGDHAPYAIDFTTLLDADERIAEIEAIKVSATAALVGIGIDEAANYRPIIDVAGKKIQLWFLIDQTYWDAASYASGGLQLPVTVRVITDAVPPKRYERSAILAVRQL